MPLRDHFRPPLSELRHWESFHSRWASVIADTLDGDLLPPGYFAEVQVHVGNRVEVDIATFEEEAASSEEPTHGGEATAVATAPSSIWAPPEPAMKLPATFPDRIAVLVFSSEAGPTFVSALELVSPANKDRPQNRRDFATKCANYLHQGIGLVVVDVVTSRQANLHDELIRTMGLGDAFLMGEGWLAATSYRPAHRKDVAEIDVWSEPLSIGQPLPVLPLPLDKGQCIRLDIEESYELACQRSRLP